MYERYLRPDELMHHGVKGQHWGVQNGPPYPLDSSISTGKSLRDLEKQQKSNAKRIKDRKSADSYAEEIIEESDGLRNQKNEIQKSKYYQYGKEYYKNEGKYLDLVAKYAYDTRLKKSGWSLSDVKEMYEHGDFNQGDNTSQAMFMADKGYFNKKDLVKAFDMQTKWSDSCEEVAKRVLGKYGSKTLDGSNDWYSKNNQLTWALDQAKSVQDFINFTYNVAETSESTIKDMQKWLKTNNTR